MKNQIKKVLSLVLVFAMCLSTFVIGASAATTCTEAHNGQGETQKYYGWQDPTCEEMGGDKYKCTVCGEAYALNTKAPLGHNVATWTEVAPTCTEQGYTWGTCLNGDKCNATDNILKKDFVAATGHTLVTKEGDCKIKECTKCDYTEASNSDHSWVAQEAIHTAPSCEGTGIMPYACECGAKKEVVINAYGHNYVEVLAVNPTTCTETGTKAHYKCSDCGQLATKKSDGTYEKTTADKLVIAAGHLDVKEGESVTTGCVKTTPKYCDLCKTDLEPKVEDAHVFIADNKTDATCTTWGYIYFTCEKCGYVDNDKTVTIAPTGHSFQEKKNDAWVIKEGVTALGTVSVTCTTAGATVYTCTNTGCRETKQHTLDDGTTVTGVAIENAAALGHDYKETTAKVPAECGKDGTTSIETCSKCGDVRGGNKIDALVHNFVEKVYAVTCVKDGYTCEECTYCGIEKENSRTNPVVADGTAHEYVDVLVTDPETYNKCENPGYYVKVCKFCGDEDAEKRPEPVLEHKWVKLYTLPGDCVSESIERWECSTCGKAENRLGAKDTTVAGHIAAMGEDVFNALAPIKVVREASCTAPAYYAYKCTKCGDTFETQGEWGHTLVPKSEDDVTDCFTGAIGYAGKWCTACEKWVGADEGGVEKTPITHEADATMPKQDYVCKSEVKGWEEFDYCSICKAKYDVTADDGSVTNAYIDALKAANAIYHAYAKVDAQAATCTADGWNEYCGTCQAATNAGIKLDKLGHDHVKVDYKTRNCGQIGYDHFDCSRCDDEYVTNYKKALEHAWVAGTITAPTCTDKGYTTYTCSTCGATKQDDETNALGHKNAAGETITSACTDTVTDRYCVQCDTTIAKEHSYTAADVHQATCTENGYTISLCDYCGEEKLTDFVEALGHTFDNGVVTLEPTPTTSGKKLFTCLVCGYEETRDIDPMGKIEMNITVDSGIRAGADIVNGGLVKFNVALNVSDIDMALLMAKFNYNSDVLEFEGIELDGEFFQVKNEAGEIEVIGNMMAGNDAENGVVTITVGATYTANKIPTDVNVNGVVDFVTLTFRVADDKFNTSDSINGQITQVANVAEEMLLVDAPVATANYEISKLASVNADGTIDIIDLMAVSKMFFTDMNGTLTEIEYWLFDENGEKVEVNYLAEADIDMDGFVTLDDYALLNKFLTTNITYKELVLTSQTNG